MRGPDRQTSLSLVSQFRRQVADALGFLKNAQCAIDDLLARGRDAREVAAFADENLEPQFILEQLDLLADPGCDVCSFWAAAVMLRPLCATAAR